MKVLYQEKNAILYKFDGETLRIEPWGANAFRVRSVMMGEIQDTDWALLTPKAVTADIRLEEREAEITNGKIKAVISVDGDRNSRLAFYNQRDELLLQERARGGALSLRARKFQPMIGGDYRLTASFESDPEEKLFGMGQYQQDILNVKNCNLELAHRNSQASVPFVMSSAGYGFLWHNPAVGRVSFGKNYTEWVAESTKQLDYYIVAGDSPAEIEEAYADATGKVPMMPEYGLGFWQCKLRYWNQKQLLDVAREYKRRGLPINVIVCDFFHWPKCGDFRFEEEFFPAPEEMVRELKEMGIELMVSVWPQVDEKSENYDAMREQGLLVKTETGLPWQMNWDSHYVFYDATNPAARKYVWDQCKEHYYEKGIHMFWLDEAEPEFSDYHFDNYRYHNGSVLQVGNMFPKNYAQGFYEGMEAEGQKNIVNLVRCAWAGSQRYGTLVWSGDVHSTFEALRSQLCAGLNMGIAGIPWWTTDIGGFTGGDVSDDSFKELLIRWFEWGCFCPVMRLHGDRNNAGERERVFHADGTEALSSGVDNEVWSYGEGAYAIMEKYMQLREKMRPYIRRLMQEAHEKGTPVMRPMFYEFPEDEECWELQEQYMFGDSLLVAPVVYEGEYEKEVYLPAGVEWIDANTGEEYEGGQTVVVDAPIEIIPVFRRKDKPSVTC